MEVSLLATWAADGIAVPVNPDLPSTELQYLMDDSGSEVLLAPDVDKDKKEQLVTAPNGRTNWRFLTILDPASEHHQRQAVASGRRASSDEYRGVSNSLTYSSRPASRATAMPPSPNYQQHLGAGARA